MGGGRRITHQFQYSDSQRTNLYLARDLYRFFIAGYLDCSRHLDRKLYHHSFGQFVFHLSFNRNRSGNLEYNHQWDCSVQLRYNFLL